jgi:hypothetical protein
MHAIEKIHAISDHGSLSAAAFNAARESVEYRQIKSLMARSGLEDRLSAGKKITEGDVDAALAPLGLETVQRIRVKRTLERAGLMSAR